jgi:hypothetical protein
MVDEFGAEERLCSELLDFLVVFRVFGERARAGLCKAGNCAETEKEQNAEQAADHEPPQGNAIAGDFINCFPQRRNQSSRISTIWGELAYDWPPFVLGIEERNGWKNN